MLRMLSCSIYFNLPSLVHSSGKSSNLGLNARFSELLLKYNLSEDLVKPFKFQLQKIFSIQSSGYNHFNNNSKA